MKRLAVVFAATMLVFGFLAVHLWLQLQGEHEQIADLKYQIYKFERSPPLMPVAQVNRRQSRAGQ